MIATTLNTQELGDLCRTFNVKELYLFGSAATGDSNPDSDLDFIVKFNRTGPIGAFDQFIDFKNQLEELYGLPVDLYHDRKFRNTIFQHEVTKSKRLLYAA